MYSIIVKKEELEIKLYYYNISQFYKRGNIEILKIFQYWVNGWIAVHYGYILVIVWIDKEMDNT